MRPSRAWPTAIVLVGSLIFGLTTPAGAQDSRQEALAQQRAEKAQRLRPYEPDLGERVLDRMKNFPILSDSPYGWYPLFGGIVDGAGWLRTGVGYRRNFGEAGQFWTGDARISNRGYWQLGGTLELPDLIRDVVGLRLMGWQQHAPGVDFYGIGNDTVELDDPARGDLDTTVADVLATLRPYGPLSVGGGFGYQFIDSGELAFRRTVPPLSPLQAVPGDGRDVRYLHGQAFVDLDWRESPGYTRRGSHARLAAHHFGQTNGSRFSFLRMDATASHHFSFLNGSRVIAVHALASVTSVGDGQTVPYFMLPYIGGGTTVRNLPSFRYRDRHRLVLNAEYRWRASEIIDMVLFGDAGKVASTRSELDLSDLSSAVGLGVRLHGPSQTAVRVEAAYGVEGLRFRFAFGPVF